MKRSYEIRPSVDTQRGGWTLTLLEDGQEAGSSVFLVPDENLQAGISWWNALSGGRRSHWLMMAASTMPAAARHAFLLANAYNDAMEEGESWADAKQARVRSLNK